MSSVASILTVFRGGSIWTLYLLPVMIRIINFLIFIRWFESKAHHDEIEAIVDILALYDIVQNNYYVCPATVHCSGGNIWYSIGTYCYRVIYDDVSTDYIMLTHNPQPRALLTNNIMLEWTPEQMHREIFIQLWFVVVGYSAASVVAVLTKITTFPFHCFWCYPYFVGNQG